MSARVAIVKVSYENGIATTLTVPVVFTAVTAVVARAVAVAYIRKNLLVPSDVLNRVDLLAVEVSNKDLPGTLKQAS